MRSFVSLVMLALAAPLPGQVPSPVPDSARRAPPPAMASPVPGEDAARAAEAEVRVALFDLISNRPLSALNRLERLRGAAPANVREPLHFLLAQAYYRLGMRDAFRAVTQELLAGTGGSRFGEVLRAQLMVDAYRSADYTRAAELASQAGAASDTALTALVTGLVRYQVGNYAGAREAFATARQGSGVYAPYAQYMDALAMLRGDTTQTAATIEALRAVAGSVTGEMADQARLTAAQLAYASGQFDAAISLAEQVGPASGFGGEAQFTRAWSLYRAGRFEAAIGAFSDFAMRYPQLIQRDEGRLMAGQAMLDAGRADAAEGHFRAVADSMMAEIATIQSQGAAALSEVAAALVAARSAGIVFLLDPAGGKVLAIPDAAGAERNVMLRVFSETGPTIPSTQAPPEIVSLADVDARVSAIGAALAQGPARRALYAPASRPDVASFAKRSGALASADVRFALAQYRLQLGLDDTARRLAQLQRLRALFEVDSAEIAGVTMRLATARDSLARMRGALDAGKVRVREMIKREADATRSLAAENAALIDSTRAANGAFPSALETPLLAIEAQTASLYRELADIVDGSLDALIARSPVFALRDSLNAKLERLQPLLLETQTRLASTVSSVAAEIAQLQDPNGPQLRDARTALAAAEAERTLAETNLRSLLEAELRSRSAQIVAQLRKDTEAAEFGLASAGFFKAIDVGRTGAPTATPGTPPVNGGTPRGAAERSTLRSGTPTTPR